MTLIYHTNVSFLYWQKTSEDFISGIVEIKHWPEMSLPVSTEKIFWQA